MLLHWIWLSLLPLSPRRRWELLDRFSDPEALFFARDGELSGLPEKTRAVLAKRDLGPAEKVLEQSQEKGIRLLPLRDPDYPDRLKNIADPPVLLYCRGRLPDFDRRPPVGVVGTRKASAYGLSAARRMGYQLAQWGFLVVTGMAVGVDAMSAVGALAAGAPVVGVLGSGVDVEYPAENRALLRDTAENGCLLSEFPPGTPADRWHFPQRNRILSGLCAGVVVVEAPARSGSLITARLASEQGRDVFVVPGNVDVASFAGSNALLRDGAILVTCAGDVAEEYLPLYPQLKRPPLDREDPAFAAKVAQEPALPKKSRNTSEKKDKKSIDKEVSPPYSDAARPALTETERKLLDLMGGQETLVDTLIAASGLPGQTVLSALTTLQIKGAAIRLPGSRVAPK